MLLSSITIKESIPSDRIAISCKTKEEIHFENRERHFDEIRREHRNVTPYPDRPAHLPPKFERVYYGKSAFQ